ncbi:hypothetical protein Acr_00g0063120 [Actinidia rufa]|uniref:SET domain-containing protein n=1 Tax=Actinidia rufa TaxID=165716 RepID=A0A7J0DQK3_9ERIC|nr:hypothetical protein Acr_00g0063120 [Actinidia rufa]
MEEEEGTLESFLKWAAELGISDSQSNSSSCLGQSLSVAHFPHAGGRGLAAVRDIRKGELILRVPKLALMSSESLRKDKKLFLSINNHASLSSTQVNDAIWAAEKATAKAEFDWKEAISLMEELNLKHRLQTFKAWLWASGSISSRTLHVPWDDAGCLCPVGDLFNYAAPGEEEAFNSENAFIDSSCWRNHSSTEQYEVEQIDANLLRLTDGGYEEDVSAYCFYARRNYKKGEQVLLSYGTYTNLELLEHYGFLLDENPNDKAFIPLESEIYSSCSWPKDSLYIQQNGKPSFALLSALRLWLTHPTQRRSVGHLAYSGSQLSPDNEIIVMGWISNNCKAVLKSFVTSIEEDELLLRTIDKMQDFCTTGGLANLPSAFEGEVHAFLENKGSIHGESGSKFLQSRHIRRYMDRWKLAVQWRLRYKRTLVDCITYCIKVIMLVGSLDLVNRNLN